MELSYKLEKFEGPLDLLLHLIEKNKVNIYDIPIAEITDQYMEYVRQMDEENLDVVSEFLVMAATLLDIKARMLLPKEVNEEGEEEDPRAELVMRLLEYKKYRLMSEELKDMGVRGGPGVLQGSDDPAGGQGICRAGGSRQAPGRSDAHEASEDLRVGDEAAAG